MNSLRASTLFVGIIGLYAASPATAQGLSGSSISINTQGCGVATTSPVTCTANGTTFNAQAEGNRTTMRLSMDYSAINNLGFPGAQSGLGGTVTIFDSITITGGLFGTPGTLRVNWAVAGTLAANGTGDFTSAQIDYNGLPQAEWRVCGSNNGSCGSSTKGSPVNETVATVIPFVFGTPLSSFSFALRGATSGGSLNFYNTAQLQPLVVMDSNGNPVSGAQVHGDGGFSYAVEPEPADLSVTMADSPDPVIRGDNITYNVNVQNIGPAAATNVSLIDTLPSGAKLVSNSGAPGWSCTTPATKGQNAGAPITCTVANLAPAASATFTIVIQVNSGTKASTISNTAVVSGSSSDPNSNNNAATASTTVRAHK